MNRPALYRLRAGGSHGFTLLELLVGVAIMVGVLTGAYFSVSSALESQKMVESRADIAQTARVALALLSQDLRAACPLARDLDFAGLHRLRGEITADNLDFSTHNWHPVAPGEGDVCEVSYFVDQNPETGEVGLWRRRDPSPDEKPLEGGRREEIAAGVRGFRLEYYDGFRWYESWGKTSGSEVEEKASSRTEFNWYGLPDAVRIQLTLSAPQESRQERSPQPKQATGGAMGGGAMGGGAMGQPKSPRTMTFQTVVRLNLSTRPKGSTGPGIEPPGSSSAGSPAPPGQGGK